jgi:hypothetical protein
MATNRAFRPRQSPIPEYVVRSVTVFKAREKASLGLLVISGQQKRKLIKTMKLFTEDSAKVVTRRISTGVSFVYLILCEPSHCPSPDIPSTMRASSLPTGPSLYFFLRMSCSEESCL